MNAMFLLYNVIAAVVTVTVHGFVKAFVSSKLGDPLPKRDGRVTLNPIKHIEPIGFIIMVAFGFGWAKPVETASIYYQDRRRGTLITHTLPSVANLLFGIILFSAVSIVNVSRDVGSLLTIIALFNLRNAFFNIIPIHPLDGAKVLAALRNPNQVIGMANKQMFLQIILVMAVFWGFVGRIIDSVCWTIFSFISRIYGA